MRNILLIIFLGYLVVNFTACGGGENNAHFSNAEQLISIIDCNDTAVGLIPDDYTTMLSADILVNDVTPTIISTFHDVTGNKKVCVVSGSAHLIRK